MNDILSKVIVLCDINGLYNWSRINKEYSNLLSSTYFLNQLAQFDKLEGCYNSKDTFSLKEVLQLLYCANKPLEDIISFAIMNNNYNLFINNKLKWGDEYYHWCFSCCYRHWQNICGQKFSR
jgi:hypothetical protein